MASPKTTFRVIQITRDITGPPRRCRGQVLSMTDEDIKQQKLVAGVDYELVGKATIADVKVITRDIPDPDPQASALTSPPSHRAVETPQPRGKKAR